MAAETWMWAIMSIVALVPSLVLALPLTTYIKNILWLRRQEIVCCLSERVLIRYFQTFYSTELNTKSEPDSTTLARKFDLLYSTSFGRWKFVMPTAFLLALITVSFVFTAHGMKPYLSIFLGLSTTMQTPHSMALVVFAGLSGGYMWVLLNLMSRMQERQLTPSDLYECCTRIILCIPVALALTALFKGTLQDHALASVAFMLGAFPISILLTFMRRTAASKLNLEQSFADQATMLTQLQGIGRDQAETFAKEGVSTILQLAYSDPVDITIRTGFSFSYTVDCCSQALAWLNFENDMPKLRRFGLRGAQEICTLVLELSRKTGQDEVTMDEEQKCAGKSTEVIASELKIDITVLRRMFGEIAFDPYTQFLCDVWQSDWN